MSPVESVPAIVQVPLVEAVVEVRFPGDAAVEGIRGNFQQVIQQEFPELLVPNAQAGEALALKPYLFTNDRQTRRVGLALNRFMYSSMEYPGWRVFLDKVLALWNHLNDLVSIAQLTRVGVRFVNSFEVDTLGATLDPNKVPYLAYLTTHAPKFRLDAVFEKQEGHLLIQTALSPETTTLHLALDAFTTGSRAARLRETLDALHTMLEREFLLGLNPQYADQLVTRSS